MELDAGGRRRLAPLRLGVLVVIALAALAGCASLTPKQAAGLQEMQRFVDEVTEAYGVGRVHVLGGHPDRGWMTYSRRTDSLSINNEALDQDDLRLSVVRALAWATLSLPSVGGSPTPEQERPRRAAANQRGVEIMVKFLGMTEWEAIDYFAKHFVAWGKVYATHRASLNMATTTKTRARFYVVHPCDQLRDLWTHFAIAEPEPACQR